MKFIISDLIGKVPIWVSLPFIATVVAVSIAASLWKTRGMAHETLPGWQSATEEKAPGTHGGARVATPGETKDRK